MIDIGKVTWTFVDLFSVMLLSIFKSGVNIF